MVDGKDPLLVLGMMDNAGDKLALLGWSKTVGEDNQRIAWNLSSLYTIQSKSILARPSIIRSEIDDVIRDVQLNDKVEKDMLSSALAVKGEVDPHVLYVTGGQHAPGESTGLGEGETYRKGGKNNGKQLEQQRRRRRPQQPQHGGGKGETTLTGPPYHGDATAGQYICNDSGPIPFGIGGQNPPTR